MKRFDKRHLALTHLVILAVVFSLGCSTREDAAEVLDLCGNHSCGELVMVTIDTSASGFQYLDPALSPSGGRVAFTADWSAIPSLPPEDFDRPFLTRQILVMPVPPVEEIWTEEMRRRLPVSNIQVLGAQLLRLNDFTSLVRGTPQTVVDAHILPKGEPVWLDEDNLLFLARFSRRDRFLRANVNNPALTDPQVVFYEPDDLLEVGGQIYYHNDPALSPDGRWLAFTRFGCDRDPIFEDANCTRESIWILDMESTGDPTAGTIFQITSEALNIEDPAWSPDGNWLVFSSTTDLIGNNSNVVSELFRIRFDAQAAESAEAILDLDLRRLTTTGVSQGDPIVGLHNYAPTYSFNGDEIFFVSTRRAPGTTLRGRSLWRIPADGRLDPSLLFFSRRDDVHPTIHPVDGSVLFSSRMGFPTAALDALEQQTIDFWLEWNESAPIPLSESEILRRAAEARRDLEFYEDVMSHLYIFRRF
jgi:dipeptidyl aminopeptidase/acylaminoacyl peptidase